ncbi:MAG: cupin domain-containing protein [Prochlorothrix sp.]|nr:cupin domain-containing protein [Prochlorothrix sp.]
MVYPPTTSSIAPPLAPPLTPPLAQSPPYRQPPAAPPDSSLPIGPSPANCMIPILQSPPNYRAYRISPEDKNRIAILFDPSHADISLAVCVEIFEPGGKTPRHRHPQAAEMFFVLHGEGMAFCDGKAVTLKTGDSILVPPNGNHGIQNTSDRRLYLLCIMVPNEDFIELIRNGTPVELDAADLAILQGGLPRRPY